MTTSSTSPKLKSKPAQKLLAPNRDTRLRPSQRPENLPSYPPFTTRAAPQADFLGGARSSGALCPDTFASSLLRTTRREWSGPALACYMLRRFGWPNNRSDDYKELFAWTLTTPLPGLYLYVCPYMGQDGTRPVRMSYLNSYFAGGACMHFGFRYTQALQRRIQQLQYFPSLRAADRQRVQIVRDWWAAEGHQKFAFISAAPEDNEKMMMEWGADKQRPGHTWGLYRRSKTINEAISAKSLNAALHPRVLNHLAYYLNVANEDASKPEKVTLKSLGITAPWPAFDRDQFDQERAELETTGLIGQCNAALFAAIKDLLTPTSVRDVYFNGLGKVDDGAVTNEAPAWPGAGYRPDAWFTMPKLRRKASPTKQP